MYMSRRDAAFLSVARYFATKSSAKKMHGAVVVRGGRVLGTGFNKNKNNPEQISPEHIKTHASRHAEIEAIRDANWNVKNATIYVARVNKQGQDRDSMPCATCSKIIESHGIKKIVYTRS